eukprot:TRINITY_DN107_c0_g1_i3.p1 TRINITY_DN107_c0_g1~~TRINITY_DN107_c0_g1_i3.p1  ORF type:complete len:347 (-),score=63.84 TRINITY_DN107_c0_g1_i3:137-1177(-)
MSQYILAQGTEYYFNSPAQMEPPNGITDQSTIVTLEKESGSYSLVNFSAWVPTDSLKPVNFSAWVPTDSLKPVLKIALCVGINDYPGQHNDLHGCVNDAHDWADLLQESYNFQEVNLLLNSEATRENILEGLESLIEQANSEERAVIVFSYSGHGTWKPHTGGFDLDDLIDMIDGRDEAICAYDGDIIDDELRDIFSRAKKSVRITVISDSCHSGTITKRFNGEDDPSSDPNYKPDVYRYKSPIPNENPAQTNNIEIKKKFFVPNMSMKEILLSGCDSKELSYDSYINGKSNGAFTHYAIEVIKTDPHQTYQEFYKKIREKLPNNRYDQTPQLEGSTKNKHRNLFS